ncbi:MAG TPA: ArsR family transcriptional regulator [Solirubrobacterales bacterium]|nr:ArsR family transcriptional regulator [Solirubrobacterales bacterium]
MPLNVHVLDALRDEELALTDLSRAVGHPPATTMRSYLKALADLGILERRQEGGFPGAVAYSLGPAGERFLAVASALQGWLEEAPHGPVGLGDPSAKSAIKALVEGWNATIIRVLAARPLALTELAKLIASISYPTLERRLAAMRRTGQLQARRKDSTSRGTPYEVTPWLRQAVAPLVAAVAWERECAAAQTKGLNRIDIEAFFLLALPLVELPEEFSGRCRLAVEVGPRRQPEYAGATVTWQAGRPRHLLARPEGDADAWVVGTAGSWLDWLSGTGDRPLELGGDGAVARALLEALRHGLFPAPRLKAA